MIILIRGASNAGKTMLAYALGAALIQKRRIMRLDGDEFRDLMGNHDYSDAGRERNLRDAAELALRTDDKFTVIICSFMCPKRAQVERFLSGTDGMEVFLTSDRGPKHEGSAVVMDPPGKSAMLIRTDGLDDLYAVAYQRIIQLALEKTFALPTSGTNGEGI